MNLPYKLDQDFRPDMLLKNVSPFEEYLMFPKGGVTDREPPKSVPDKLDTISIEPYLGIYVSGETKIEVYAKNIKKVSESIGTDPIHLENVVYYHEQAHAIIHLGISQNDRIAALKDDAYLKDKLKRMDECYSLIDSMLHEQLAQLLTYHAIKSIQNKYSDELARYQKVEKEMAYADGLMATFMALMRHQPPEYIVEDFLSVSLNRFNATLRQIKCGGILGKYETWKEIMQWA